MHCLLRQKMTVCKQQFKYIFGDKTKNVAKTGETVQEIS